MITVQSLKKGYSTGEESFFAVNNVSLNIGRGETVTLLGPSGCGKTTTLRCIAGLERPTGGRITIDGKVVADMEEGIFVPPNRRELGMVFQSYAIWPHMTVLENVAYALEGRGLSREARRKLSLQALETVRLAHLADRPAPRLSGGQQQRVAIARALVGQPRALLFDEPLSNLDAQLRGEMRAELSRLQKQIGLTSIYVTHDQAEALAISDWVAVMKSGRVVEYGKPVQIYRRPHHSFTASFVGASNLISGKVVNIDQVKHEVLIETSIGKFLGVDPTESLKIGDAAQVSIRPEDLKHKNDEIESPLNCFMGTIDFMLFTGAVVETDILVGDTKLQCLLHRDVEPVVGSRMIFEVASDSCVILPLSGEDF